MENKTGWWVSIRAQFEIDFQKRNVVQKIKFRVQITSDDGCNWLSISRDKRRKPSDKTSTTAVRMVSLWQWTQSSTKEKLRVPWATYESTKHENTNTWRGIYVYCREYWTCLQQQRKIVFLGIQRYKSN